LAIADLLWSSGAGAQQQPQGFAVERLYPSAPGGGWFVMDTLDMRGGLGGVAGLAVGYERDSLRVRSADGSQRLAVVSDDAFADFGFAATYQRWRFYLNFTMPLYGRGQTGMVGAYYFHAPYLDLGSNPDNLTDARIGFDGRLLGDADSRFRLGASAQLFVPNGSRCNFNDGTITSCDYDTDGTYRAMGRILAAGDVGRITYAGQLGVHVRPLDDSPVPGSPRGSELLFGVSGGAKLPIAPGSTMVVIVGPELYGASAFRTFLDSTGTALEALLTGRLEGTADDGQQLRIKMGVGGGLDARFGAPEWRLLFGIEVFDHHARPDNGAQGGDIH
jgi:hypothetical protein